ncbi:M3 family metallopeptidase [Nocardia sp. NRRL S-836]|uniref:M3 family metallopeptidase n=1 Tax=Nocardia sp. NRRL S-836 TaxID=1519492 RepID=UPI0006AF9FA1|nr:M3 family metallopeptidase [Nocardia sp. NRRL S-836]KOV87583.1 hypothetical protein ADL03_06725 [Nocardia sp. NRRL S-836]
MISAEKLLQTVITPARRELAAVITPLLAAEDTAAWVDPQLYQRVVVVHDRRDKLDLDQHDTALLTRIHDRFVDAGAHLDPAAQHELRVLDVREAELERALDARMSAGLHAAAVHVTDRAELAGLDDDEIAVAAAAATDRGLPGWVLTLAAPTVQPILARLAHRGLRHRVHEASISRCSRGGDNDTRELLVQLYRLRATRARLRGFAHHAEAVLSRQTAGSAETVTALLHALAPLAAGKAAEEDAVLTDSRIAADRLYLAQQARQRHRRPDRHSGDAREYLPLAAVLTGARKLVQHLHAVHLTERTDLPVHVPSARVWEAVAEDGRHLGMVLVDLHQRDGKRAGAWTTEITAQSQLLGRRALVCMSLNLPPIPPGGGDVVLTVDQAVTVFHEIGHVVHAMVSDVRYPSHSGFAHLPHDIVEAPAVIHEMWALHPHVLTHYARHHLTGEPIPIGLGITELIPTRHGVGYRMVQDVATALLDLAWHSIGPDDETGSVDEFGSGSWPPPAWPTASRPAT